MTQQIRFDDVEALNAAASDEFGEWGEAIEVSQDLINGFAELTGDKQWIHIDVERARRESPFGGPIAHGFLTLSLLPTLKASAVTIIGHGNATNYGAEKLRFLAPVPAGAKIHARARIVRADARPNGTLLTTEIEIRVVDGAKPSLLYGMQILYQAPRS